MQVRNAELIGSRAIIGTMPEFRKCVVINMSPILKLPMMIPKGYCYKDIQQIRRAYHQRNMHPFPKVYFKAENCIIYAEKCIELSEQWAMHWNDIPVLNDTPSASAGA